MELNEWQNGLRLCMENIIDLFIDANILMNQNKWSRGCFLFITAYEEVYYLEGSIKNKNKNLLNKKFIKKNMAPPIFS